MSRGLRCANVHKNYVAIINPNTGRAMLNLKKYGECTLIDPRACINHYECAADVACILYAPVSLRYFHYMVHSGYVSNKTRVVLNDTKYDTYVFVIVENIDSQSMRGDNSVEGILRGVQRQEGRCRIGTDVLQAGTPEQVGYFFHQPASYFRRSKSRHTSSTSRVYTGKEWAKRCRLEKQQHDCQRRIFNENRKQDLLVAGCHTKAAGCGAADDPSAVAAFHTATPHAAGFPNPGVGPAGHSVPGLRNHAAAARVSHRTEEKKKVQCMVRCPRFFLRSNKNGGQRLRSSWRCSSWRPSSCVNTCSDAAAAVRRRPPR